MPYLTMQDGTKLYYQDRGKGQTILFAHGLNSSHIKNRDFLDEFRDEYKRIMHLQKYKM